MELIFHMYFPQMLIQKLNNPKDVQNVQINLKNQQKLKFLIAGHG